VIARLALALAAVLLPGLAAGQDVLRLFNWNNYITEGSVKAFEARCKCRLAQDYYADNEEMLAKLAAADLVVGFNALGFDYRVLRGYTDRDLRALPTFDLLDAVHARLGFRLKLEPPRRHPGVARVARLMLPATIGLAATQLNLFFSTLIASMLVQGSVSWLWYAFRIMQLPIGVFGVALATVSLPALSRAAVARDLDSVKTTLSALNGVPSWKVTPFRSVKRQVVLLTARHDSASAGTNLESLVTSTSGSNMCRCTDVEEIE